MRQVTVLAVLAALVASAGWTAAQAGDEPAVTDPTGDATLMRSGDAVWAARGSCWAGGEVTARACDGLPWETVPPHLGGAPAPASLDIVHGRFDVDGDTLAVEIALASLDASFPGTGLPSEALFYGAVWTVGDDPWGEGIALLAIRSNGTLQLDSYLWTSTGHCAQSWACYFHIPVEVVPGTPGFLRWTIPRTILAATAITDPFLSTSHMAYPAGGRYVAHSTHVRDATLQGSASAYALSNADLAGPGTSVPLPPPSRAFDPALDTIPSLVDPAADHPYPDRPDLDILGVEFRETERTFHVSIQAMRVNETPEDHEFRTELYPTTGAAIAAGYVAQGGARNAWSNVCGSSCAPGSGPALRKAAEFEIVPGEPGWINVTFARTDLGNPGPGDAFTYLVIGLYPRDWETRETTPAGSLVVGDFAASDVVWETPPWWFALGKPRVVDQGASAFFVEDEIGDVRVDQDPTLSASSLVTNLDAYDITSLRADATSPTHLRFELGVNDLSRVAPPSGFTAVFYGVALSTESGTFMVGYYDDRSDREFFCAPDTAVLTTPEADPRDVIWQPIEGLLSVTRDRAQGAGGGSTPGSIVFLAPYSCFMAEPGVDLEVESIAGATFLLRQLEQEVAMQRVDDVASGGEAILIPAAATAPAPWYASPFGIANFWDITGIVFAVLVALFGALALRRKRGALRRYLHEIDDVLRDHAAASRAREAALVAIQHRLREDLLRHRITESHFVIVERRLDRELSKVRVQALGDAFGDLPHRLLLTLQDLLRDGAMDREDWQLFRTQLQSETHLTDASRAAIERRVEAWVREAPAAEAKP